MYLSETKLTGTRCFGSCQGSHRLSATLCRVQIFERFTECGSWFISCTLTNWQRALAEPENCLCIAQKFIIHRAKKLLFLFPLLLKRPRIHSARDYICYATVRSKFGSEREVINLFGSSRSARAPGRLFCSTALDRYPALPPVSIAHLHSSQGSSAKQIAANCIFNLKLDFDST